MAGMMRFWAAALFVLVCVVEVSFAAPLASGSVRKSEWTVSGPRNIFKILPTVEAELSQASIREATAEKKLAIISIAEETEKGVMLTIDIRGKSLASGKLEVIVSTKDESQEEKKLTHLLWWFGHFEHTPKRQIRIAKTAECVNLVVEDNEAIDGITFVSESEIGSKVMEATDGAEFQICRS